MLKRAVAVVGYLAAADLPPRGHFERFESLHSCGNFVMRVELIFKFDPFLANRIDTSRSFTLLMYFIYIREIPRLNEP